MNRFFSKRIIELRKEKGLKQKEAAQELGISQALLSHYEKGVRECGLDFIIKCSEYYSVSCDYLLGASESRSNFPDFDNCVRDDLQLEALGTIFNKILNLVLEMENEEERRNFLKIIYLFLYRQAALLSNIGCIKNDAFSLPLIDALLFSGSDITKLETELIHKFHGRENTKKEVPAVFSELINSSEKIISEMAKEVFPSI